MPDPRLPQGAFLRLVILAAIGLACVFALIGPHAIGALS